MKREILFRGLTPEGYPFATEPGKSEWVYGGLAKVPKGESYCWAIVANRFYEGYEEHEHPTFIEVYEGSIGQYTGLKDKNGVKIFEGDRINGGLYNGSYRIGVVEYYKGEFGLSPEGKFAEGWCSLTYPGLEIIDNIHQTEKQDD